MEIDLYSLIKKLTGEITPVGETNEDGRRLKNLKEIISLTEKLVCDIEEASKYKNRIEYSMQEIGKKAYEFRNNLTSWKD